MPSPSNASYLIIARFVFVFLNIISISEVSKKIYSRKHNRRLILNNVLCSDEEMIHDDEAITSEVY